VILKRWWCAMPEQPVPRGALLIHAGLNDSGVCARKRTQHGSPADRLYYAGLAACRAAGLQTDDHYWTQVAANTCGAIIAVAELVRCGLIVACEQRDGGCETGRFVSCVPGSVHAVSPQELALGDYTPGRYGWVLANVQPLTEPVPCRGRQGLFRVPLDAVLCALPAKWVAKLGVQADGQ
jgi:hypothetical protein